MNKVRFLILSISILIFSVIFHFLVYGNDFTYEHISNVMFGVGIILLLPSIVVISHAYEVFYGFRYTARIFFSDSFKKEYPKFIDYKEEKTGVYKTTLFTELVIISVIFIVVSFFLAREVL